MAYFNFHVQTPRGVIVYSAETQTPRVLAIHGFKRSANALLPWAKRIPGLGFVHLPGHSAAPNFDEVSVHAWIEGIQKLVETLPEPPLIFAESLGAIVAMSVTARAVIAVEPLLSTDQLWPLHRTIRNARARGVPISPEDAALFSEPFDWVPSAISAPTLVLAGSTPLLPERDVWPEPSLLTDDDFAIYSNHPLVEAHRIPGGHTLLDHSPEDVMAVAAGFMVRHGYL